MKSVLLAALCAVLAGCGSSAAASPTTTPSTTEIPVSNPSTTELDDAADQICRDSFWTGVPEDSEFATETAALGVSTDVVRSAVRRTCPENLYRPLAKAEVDWCGDGRSFGQNYFKVVAAGVELGIESFTIVEAALVSKAANGIELSDYEVELLTAELQTMSESSRFERDWAEACRTTY